MGFLAIEGMAAGELMSVGSSAICDLERCEAVARRLSDLDVPEPKEDVPSLSFTAEEEANFWFFLAAICHQTSPVGLPALEGVVEGRLRRGWDYLLHAFRVAVRDDRSLLTPAAWKSCSSALLVDLFGPLLSDPAGRAVLVRDLGEGLARRGWDSILNAGPPCRYFVRDHAPNLLEVLAEFQAYSDPVEKKSVFFLALMKNCGLWRYPDDALLPAPVDYHEVRGHLRIGTVQLAAELLHKVEARVPVTQAEDVEIRLAVREAIQCIATASGISTNALHYLFWNLFRTYCVRGTPQCGGSEFAKLPAAYARVVENGGGRQCPLIPVCHSAWAPRALDEHSVTTEYY